MNCPPVFYVLVLILAIFQTGFTESRVVNKDDARLQYLLGGDGGNAKIAHRREAYPSQQKLLSNSLVPDLTDPDEEALFGANEIKRLPVARSNVNQKRQENSDVDGASPSGDQASEAAQESNASDKGSEKGSDEGSEKGSEKGSDEGSEKGSEKDSEKESGDAVPGLPGEIKKEEPLPEEKVDKPQGSEEANTAFGSPNRITLAGDNGDAVLEMDITRDPAFTSFTIANTDIGIEYDLIPYRERYLWRTHSAPCHSFNLKVPDELVEKSIVKVCVFRPTLHFPDESRTFLFDNFKAEEPEDNKVYQVVSGYVMNTRASLVRGRIVGRFFYGEVFICELDTNITKAYVVEEIHLLNKLMSNNPKTLRNMLMVMNNWPDTRNKLDTEQNSTIFNSVVTKGTSLNYLMVTTNPSEENKNQFFSLSTAHISYICPGDPMISFDDSGNVIITCGENRIVAENDGSVQMSTSGKLYTFRPNGRTIVKENGTNEVRTLQENEGAVAITAYTSTSTYDCVLPTPAFQAKRWGGYVCRVCVAADDLFIRHFIDTNAINNSELKQNYLALVIDRVSWILRSLDINGDSLPDNIGVEYDDQVVRWAYADDNEEATEKTEEADVELLFQSLEFETHKFADCCLGIGFTMKRFPGSAPARRPIAKGNGPSGICSGRTGRIPNNLILISGNNNNGNFTPIKESQLIYLTTNQIVAAFGASADGAGDDGCDQFSDGSTDVPRHFLMWPDVLRNATLREQRLSKCSKKDLVGSLSTCKSSCFNIDQHPFCGNGIVEDGEECDCGSEFDCKAQTCCDARTGRHPCKKTGVGCTDSAASLLKQEIALSLITIFSMILSAYYIL